MLQGEATLHWDDVWAESSGCGSAVPRVQVYCRPTPPEITFKAPQPGQ